MKDLLTRGYVKAALLPAAIVSGVLSASGVAGATTDPTLTSASDQVTSYFTDNLGVAVGAFVAVAGVLWILALIFRSVGIHRRRSVG